MSDSQSCIIPTRLIPLTSILLVAKASTSTLQLFPITKFPPSFHFQFITVILRLVLKVEVGHVLLGSKHIFKLILISHENHISS